MIFRGRQLSHLRLPRLAFHQGEPLPIYADRVSVSFDTLCGRCYITPISHRSYADTPVSRPKAHTGRTKTAPSKRAPTATSKRATTATSVAVKKKSTRAKKPAAKKKAKPTPRRKAKSKAKSKGRSKTKSRKVLTKEQKEKLAARKKQKKEKLVANKPKQKIRDLKTTALDPPKHGPLTVWATLVAEGLKEPGSTVKNRTPEISAQYKALSPERREHYNRIVLREKAAREAAYRQWLESYTPDQIRLANIARTFLRRKGMKKYPKLADERQVRRTISPHIYFIKDRQASAAYAAIKPREKIALLCKEWSAAPAAEKKKFEDMASQDRQRYIEESKAVYNLNIPPKGSRLRPKYAT